MIFIEMNPIYFIRGTWDPTKVDFDEDISPSQESLTKKTGAQFSIFYATFGASVVVHPSKETDYALKRYLHQRTEHFVTWDRWPDDIESNLWMSEWDLIVLKKKTPLPSVLSAPSAVKKIKEFQPLITRADGFKTVVYEVDTIENRN